MFKALLRTPSILLSAPGLAGVVARGATAAFLIQSASFGIKYINLVFFARWMGAAEFGKYSYSLAWVQVLATIAGLGLNSGAVKFIPAYTVKEAWAYLRGLIHRSRSLTLTFGLFISISGSILIYFFFFHHPLARTLLFALWLVPALGLANLHLEITRGLQRVPEAYTPLLIGHPLLLTGLAFSLLLLNGRLASEAGIFASFAAFLVVLLIQGKTITIRLPTEVHRRGPRYAGQEWLRVSLPLLFVSLALILLNQTGTLFLGWIDGPVSAGIYAAGRRTITLVSFILLAVNTIAAPVIASLHTGQDFKALQRLIKGLTVVTLAVSSGTGLLLIIFGRSIFSLFGPEFVSMYGPSMFLIIGEIVNASAGPVGYLINLTGFERFGARVYATSAIVNIGLNALLVPLYGLAGAAAASMLTTVLWNVWLSTLVKEKLGLQTFFYLIWPSRNFQVRMP